MRPIISNPNYGKPSISRTGPLLTSSIRWLGFLLMNVGETGNFISYAWAPASVVAPLGTVSSPFWM